MTAAKGPRILVDPSSAATANGPAAIYQGNVDERAARGRLT